MLKSLFFFLLQCITWSVATSHHIHTEDFPSGLNTQYITSTLSDDELIASLISHTNKHVAVTVAISYLQ